MDGGLLGKHCRYVGRKGLKPRLEWVAREQSIGCVSAGFDFTFATAYVNLLKQLGTCLVI